MSSQDYNGFHPAEVFSFQILHLAGRHLSLSLVRTVYDIKFNTSAAPRGVNKLGLENFWQGLDRNIYNIWRGGVARGLAVDGYSELIQTNEKRLPLNFLNL